MERLGRRGKAGIHKVHEPANTDTQRAANPVQGDLLAEQALHQGTVFCVNHPVGGVYNELAAACLALVILLAVMDMAVFLEQL
jgi:hypothetical protein